MISSLAKVVGLQSRVKNKDPASRTVTRLYGPKQIQRERSHVCVPLKNTSILFLGRIKRIFQLLFVLKVN